MDKRPDAKRKPNLDPGLLSTVAHFAGENNFALEALHLANQGL
jgi:hypothetical protein